MDIARPSSGARRKRWLLVVGGTCAAIATVALSLGAFEQSVPAVDRASVLLGTVERGEFVSTVRGTGTLVSKELRWLAAQTTARVDRILVKPGEVVRADSVVIELSNPEVEDSLVSAEAALAGARSDLAARRAEMETKLLDAQSNLANVDAEYQMACAEVEAQAPVAAEGAMPRVQFRRTQITEETTKARLDIERKRLTVFRRNMNAQVAAEEARLVQLTAALSLAQRLFDSLKVRAGLDGVLQEVPVEQGQQVQAGTNLARVARPDALRADVRIAETQAKSLALGQKASVDTRNGVVDGKVLRIDPAVQNGTVTVEIELGELPKGARPDLSIDAVIEVDRVPDALFVARPVAVQPHARVRLFRLGKDDTYATSVPVRLGRASTTSVEVTEGLARGDVVVLSDTSAFSQAERIRLK